MEILIPGLLLVALMVYASTRIKRTAAEAFESETIAGDDFVIQKPEGMLTVINGRPELLFESYSREYGKGDAGEVRQVRAELRRLDKPETHVDDADVTVEILGGVKYRTSRSETSEKGIPLTVIRRSASSGTGELVLEIRFLADADAIHIAMADELLQSFLVKESV